MQQQRNPLEETQRVSREFIINEKLLLDATDSPEIIMAFKSSPDRQTSCRAIAEALQVMFIKKNQGILEQRKLDLMAMAVFERLSSN